MGPIERSIPSVLDMLRADHADPKGGRPLAIERIYQANTITHQQYLAILDEWKREQQQERNRNAISDMEADSAILDDRMRRAGVPSTLVNVSIDAGGAERLSFGQWAYVCGDSSSSARRACMLLKGWLVANPYGLARYERSTAILSAFREDESSEMAALAGIGLLVIAGLGAEAATDWAVAKLHELLDRRMGDGLPTIVTSVCDVGELGNHLGSRGSDSAARGIVGMLQQKAALIRA